MGGGASVAYGVGASLAFHWRSTSYTTMGAAAATLSEFLTPYVGISTTPSHSAMTAGSTPVTSEPTTSATPRSAGYATSA